MTVHETRAASVEGGGNRCVRVIETSRRPNHRDAHMVWFVGTHLRILKRAHGIFLAGAPGMRRARAQFTDRDSRVAWCEGLPVRSCTKPTRITLTAVSDLDDRPR